MPFFPNHILLLYEYNERSEELNPFYEPLPEYEYVGSVPCDFQTASTNDVNLEVGGVLTDTFKAYVPADTKVSRGMRFRLAGAENTYSLVGREVVNSRFFPTQHIKLVLTVDRKPVSLPDPETIVED